MGRPLGHPVTRAARSGFSFSRLPPLPRQQKSFIGPIRAAIENLPVNRDEARAFYEKIGSVWCPAIRRPVFFTSRGFDHLLYKGPAVARSADEQAVRLSLLPAAMATAAVATTFQEHELRRGGGEEFWGLIAVAGSRKIKVVLRQIGTSPVNFWSVVPNWRTSLRRDRRSFG